MKTPFFPSSLLCLVALLCGGSGQLCAFSVDCGNDQEPSCDGAVGVNPINPYRADLERRVTDISTFGEAPIPFQRIFHSRTLSFNAPYWDFGNAQTWQHNWNHEMRQLTSKTYGFFDIKLRYADGREYNFVAADSSGAQLVPPVVNGDRLYRWSGSTVGYTLVTTEGKEYHFQRVGSPKFQLKQVKDGKGHTWTLTHDANAKITRIANAYGRYLDIQRGTVGGVECITRVTASDGRYVDYGYGTWSPTGQPVLSSVTYPDAEVAAYTWVGSDSLTTGRPLLATANDPMYGGAGALTSYTYNYAATFDFGSGPYLVTGTVLTEKNLSTGATIVSLPLGGGPDAQIVQGNGTEVRRVYTNGRLTGSIDGAGRLTSYTYDNGGHGFIASKTTPGAGTTTFTRDYAGRVLTQTDPYNNTRTFVYNTAGFVVSFTDELGRVTTTTRDSSNRPTRVDHPDGVYETWTYNSTGQILTHRRANGGIETRVYYVAGETGGLPGDLKSVTDPLGNATTYTYAASGLMLTTTDALDFTTEYTHTPGGRLARITYFFFSETKEFDYDVFGNVIEVTDELGHATTYTYNEYQRVASVTDPLGRTTSYEYGLSPSCSACGYVDTLTRITYPSGRKIERSYDSSGKLLTETDAAGTAEAATTTRVYAASGNLASISDPLGHTTSYTYDLLDRRLTETDPLSRVTTTAYDAVGNALTVTRADGVITTTTYDLRNRPATRTDAEGNVIAYTYDPDGRLATLTDARAAVTTWTYDLAGRVTRKTYADATYEEWTYDAVGNRTVFRTPAGVTCSFQFDHRNRETVYDWSDATGDVFKTYDAVGRLTGMIGGQLASPAGQFSQGQPLTIHSYTYDDAGQLLSETSTPNSLTPVSFTVAYSYDLDGRRSQLTYPDASVVSYTYNARGQVETISDGGPPPLATFAYDLDGRRSSKTLENGVTTSYAYDAAHQLTSLTHATTTGTLASFAYAYDTGGRRTSKTIGGSGAIARTETYGYDDIDQVVSAGYGTAGSESFAYDAMGNRTTATLLGTGAVSYTANNLNQYTAVGGAAPTYDTNGNILTLPNRGFAYDSQNRLISANVGVFGLAGYHAASFTYDARNRQVSRTVDGLTTFFVWDGWNLLAEYQVSGGAPTQTARYVHGPRMDEILLQVRTLTPTPVYLHEDGLGSTYLLTDAAGSVVECYTYTAFGEVAAFDAAGAAVLTPTTRFLYTGREWIVELGLNDHRNRFYLPSLGRWLNRDPLEQLTGKLAEMLPEGPNSYAYVGNAPIGYYDLLGLMAPRPQGPTNVENGGSSNTINCQNGELVVHLGTPSGSDANDACTRKHEQKHIDDWKKHYGPNVCRGVPNGYLPVGGPGYDDMLKKSECEAYKIGKECRENALKSCGEKDSKTELEDGIKRDEAQIQKYCS